MYIFFTFFKTIFENHSFADVQIHLDNFTPPIICGGYFLILFFFCVALIKKSALRWKFSPHKIGPNWQIRRAKSLCPSFGNCQKEKHFCLMFSLSCCSSCPELPNFLYNCGKSYLACFYGRNWWTSGTSRNWIFLDQETKIKLWPGCYGGPFRKGESHWQVFLSGVILALNISAWSIHGFIDNCTITS